MRTLRTIGIAMRGAGYPNAEQTLKALTATKRWIVKDHANWLPEGLHLWRAARGGRLGRLTLAMRLLILSATSTVRCLLSQRQGDIVFAPYPAVFALWWLSWIPRGLRPQVVADAYISIWDSMYRDRALAAGLAPGGRLVKAFEARALRAAHRVIVDTVANRAWMADEFCLEPSRVFALPLAIDAERFTGITAATPRDSSRPMRVLFVGTLVPLHGVAQIAGAIRLVGASAGIEFEIIGDGQDAPVLQELELEQDRAPIRWCRQWVGLAEIAARMAHADICLGVFGGDGKASRVVPYKLYMAMAAGRAIVTQDAWSLPSDLPAPPWRGTAPNALAIAETIRELRDDPERVVALGLAGREYFHRNLAPDRLAQHWDRMLSLGTDGQADAGEFSGPGN